MLISLLQLKWQDARACRMAHIQATNQQMKIEYCYHGHLLLELLRDVATFVLQKIVDNWQNRFFHVVLHFDGDFDKPEVDVFASPEVPPGQMSQLASSQKSSKSTVTFTFVFCEENRLLSTADYSQKLFPSDIYSKWVKSEKRCPDS